MKQYRKFTLWFVALLSLVVLFHVMIWNIYTKYLFPQDYSIGDLGRMSYKLDSLLPRKDINTLDKKHFNKWDNEPINIISIGDSFSNGGGSGKNTFYQDYLATDYNLNILNIQIIQPAKNYLETIYLLINSDLLNTLKPQVIIFESTETQVLNRFSNKINTTLKLKKELLLALLNKNEYKNNVPNIKIINNLNINALKYNLFYNYDDNAYNSNCYITKLNKKLFSSKDSTSLLFYKETIAYNHSITSKAITNLNTNLNDLAKILKEKSIQLYFMPAVDKFNLYSKYLVKNSYGNSTFFEQLREMKKEYRFIDTKAILEKEIDKGVKDIFYPDDTHWSYKASAAISKSLKELGELKK